MLQSGAPSGAGAEVHGVTQLQIVELFARPRSQSQNALQRIQGEKRRVVPYQCIVQTAPEFDPGLLGGSPAVRQAHRALALGFVQ